MNYRIPLLLGAISLALAACTSDPNTARPRLLTDEEARIGDLDWLDADTALDGPGELIDVELTSCRVAPRTSTPRLVIGEPACLIHMQDAIYRID